MKFRIEFWLSLVREYISPKLGAVWGGGVSRDCRLQLEALPREGGPIRGALRTEPEPIGDDPSTPWGDW